MDLTRNQDDVNQLDFLSGGGEMEKLIRAYNWEVSSIGPIDSWPSTLKTSINIILQSSVPMVLVWEEDGCLIYNDAYSEFAGQRHPRLLGSKMEEGWPEVADFNRNMLNQVLSGKKLSYENQKLVLNRNNVPEEVWMNLYYSPIMDGKGRTLGALAVVLEITKEVVARERKNKADEALKNEQQRLHDLYLNAPAGIAIITGPNLIFKLANDPYLKLIGRNNSIVGKSLREVLPDIEPALLEIVNNVAFKGERFIADELPVVLDWDNSGKAYTRYLNFNYEPFYENNTPNGLMAYVYDVTDLVRSRKVVEDQNIVLEMITTGSELCEALDYLITSIENQSSQHIFGSIFLLNPDGKYLRHCSSPRLPKEYINALDDVDIGFFLDSADITNFSKEFIHVTNIETNSRWKEVKDLALSYNLYSCWSSPILSGEKALGIFAFYLHKQQVPSDNDIKMVEFATRTARLLIEHNKIQNTLKEREEHLQALVTATSDVIYVMSPDWSEMGLLEGRVFVPNTGKPLSKWEWFHANVPAEEHVRVKKVILEAIRTKSNFQLEHGVRRNDGSIGWTSSRAVPILNKKGDIIKWFGAATDITDRKQIEVALKESEERFRSLADQSPIIVFIIEPNEEATISYWSKTWLNYTGQSIEQALGRAWEGIVHPDDTPKVLDVYLPAFLNRKPYTIPAVRLKRHDGQYRWHHFKCNPRELSDGTFMGFVGVGTDVHDQLMAIQELESKNTQLQRINNDLDSFIYTASHDLKAPISNIEGLMTTLKDAIHSNSPEFEDQHQIIQFIDKSILKFKETILDLTDISKVQKNFENTYEELDVNEILNDVLETISSTIKETNAIIEVTIQDRSLIRFSKINLKSIFYNLVTNAIKYRSPDRVPIIKIDFTSDKQYSVLKVADNGLGLKKENIPKLFTMFKRFHDHVEGTGIGLYIVKRIIDNAGGKIEVVSEVGKGTIFNIYFKKDV